MRRMIPALFVAIFLTACAPQSVRPTPNQVTLDAEGRRQQEMAWRDIMAKGEQVRRVSFRIATANVPLCGEAISPTIGIRFSTLSAFPEKNRPIIAKMYGMDDKVRVINTTQGSPGFTEGIVVGDILVAINGKPVENLKQADADLTRILKADGKVALTIAKGEARRDVLVTAAMICNYPVFMVVNPQVNALADGSRIQIFTGMIKFCKTDDELAAIIGHEMAHNTQGHLKAKQGNSLLGTLLLDLPIAALTGVNLGVGSKIGQNMFSQDFESEADYVGLYYTSRAGYDYKNVPDIWRRMAIENPGAITLGSSHPSTSQRFVALEATAAEIEEKQKNGFELKPEMKSQIGDKK